MGSQFKSAVLEEQTANVIKQWHAGVREKRKKQKGDASNHGQEDSSSTKYSKSTNSDTSSSHHRTPTFAEISVAAETTEESQESGSNRELGRNIEGPSDFVRIELSQQVTKDHAQL